MTEIILFTIFFVGGVLGLDKFVEHYNKKKLHNNLNKIEQQIDNKKNIIQK